MHSTTLTIARRELSSLFFSPVTYLVLALFALGTTLIFLTSFIPGQAATLRMTFNWTVWLMVFLVPAISMRLICDEYKTGTIETLMTAPLGDTQVIVGKWLAALGFVCVLLAVPLAVFILALEVHSDPEYGPIVTGFLGLMLVAGMYLAIGIFASAICESQMIAWVVTVFVITLLTIGMHLLIRSDWLSPWMRQVAMYINVDNQFSDFSRGVISLSNLIYFASVIGMFLFLATKLLESRRWR